MLYIIKALEKNEKWSVLHFYFAMILGEYKIWLKQRFYKTKFKIYKEPLSGCNAIRILWIKSK